jgi:hypothetical protein
MSVRGPAMGEKGSRTGARTQWTSGVLAVALIASAVAACGGAAGPASPSQVGPAPSGAGATVPAGAGGAVPGAPSASPATTTASASAVGPSPSAVEVEMKPVVPTAMVEDLRALGLDAKSLPPIEKLEPRTLRGVMKLMARSLGLKCNDCHEEGDFAAPTRRKKIAAHMWDEFAAKFALTGGSTPGATDAPIFCDSCHQGRVQLLDRRDKKALSKWMDENFVVRLDRRDGKSVECETCHVDMEMHFLAKWGQ